MNRENENQFIALLKGMIEVSEAAKGISSEDERNLDAEGLLFKAFYHCGTAFYLRRSTEIPEFKDFKPKYLDLSSVNVLTRAAMESYIVFHYVFIQPETKGEKDLRYWTWKLSGLIARQKITATRTESIRIKEEEEEEIDRLSKKISSNSFFTDLTIKQRSRILEVGEWKLPEKERGRYPSWSELAVLSGLSKAVSKDHYSYLSEYAHSTSWSIMQIRQMKDKEIRESFIDTSLESIMVIMALFIKAYIAYFPIAVKILQKNEDILKAVKKWSYVGTTERDEENN